MVAVIDSVGSRRFDWR